MSAKNIDYSFKILEEILMLKKYNSREEVLELAETMVDVANKNEKASENIKEAYKEALNKLKTLSYEEINEIIGILSSYDEKNS